MNQTSQTKVFILGAGCSANCGYPLGKGLVGQLEEFQAEITSRFPIIEQCVRDTINLAKQFPKFDTLDQLTRHAEDDFESWRRRERSIVWDNVDQQRKNLLDKQSSALNSGFNPSSGQLEKVELKPGQFSFLKLHGSAGWWVKKICTKRNCVGELHAIKRALGI